MPSSDLIYEDAEEVAAYFRRQRPHDGGIWACKDLISHISGSFYNFRVDPITGKYSFTYEDNKFENLELCEVESLIYHKNIFLYLSPDLTVCESIKRIRPKAKTYSVKCPEDRLSIHMQDKTEYYAMPCGVLDFLKRYIDNSDYYPVNEPTTFFGLRVDK